jgi:uncharacterized membrane protein
MSTSLARSSPRAERSPAGAALLAAAAVLLFAGSWTALHHGFFARSQIIDTPLYQRYGRLMVTGKVPYRDFAVEYPPGALAAFVVPSLGAERRSAADYRHRFELLMFLCGCTALAGMALVLVGLGAGRVPLAAALAFAALAPLALGPVTLTRFDLLPAALAVCALAAIVHDRARLGLALLGAGTVVKLFPAVLLPLAVAHVWRRRGARVALEAAAAFAGVIALVIVPFAALAPHALLATIEDQARRPLQIESLGAAGIVAAHHVAGTAVQMDSSFGSQNLVGGAARTFGGLQSGLQAAALVALWIWFAARPRSNRELVAAAAGAVAVLVAFGKVLSPQFLIWLIPLVPLVRGRRGLVASALLLAALVLTQLWFPQRYWDYALRFAPAESWLVLARDLVLVALAVVLAVRLTRRAPSPPIGD